MKFARLLSTAALGGLLALGGGGILAPASMAQEGADDAVIARVDGEALYQSELLAALKDLPAQYQANTAQVVPILVQRLIDLRLIGKAARAEGLTEDDQVKAMVAAAERQIISEIYLERQLAERVPAEKVRARYDETVAAMPAADEVRARHILLETQEEAVTVIEELDAGGDFVALAKERSTGPSGPNGGDLGYFAAEQMVGPFAEAAFAMEPGSHSAEPVETRFGFHVIMVEDRRTKAVPTFEEMEPQIREEMSGQAVQEVLAGLRDGAEVETETETLEGVMEEISSGQAEPAAPAE